MSSDNKQSQSIADGFSLPDPSNIPSTKTEFRTPVGGNKRQDAVRLLFPIEGIPLEKLRESIDGLLVRIIRETAPDAGEIEGLIYCGPLGLEVVLHAATRSIDERRQTKQETFGSDVSSALTGQIADTAQAYTDHLGIELGTLNLDPLGVSGVSTCRLLLPEDETVGYVGKQGYHPLAAAFQQLNENYEPFLYQFIVSESGKNKYNIAARMAVYRPQYTHTGKAGFAKITEQGHPLDLGKLYRDFGLTSNYAIDTSDHWKTAYQDPVGESAKYKTEYSYRLASNYKTHAEVRDEADELKQLVLGKTEHRGLLKGSASHNKSRYEKYGYHGWFNIDPSQLYLFANIIPLTVDANYFGRVENRSSPEFNTAKTVRSIDSRRQGLGTGTTHAPKISPGVQNEGTAGHRQLKEKSRNWFSEQGEEIRDVEQTTESVPDLEIQTDDGLIQALDKQVDCNTVPVEPENENSSKPAKTLINAERALARGQHVIFVFYDEDKEGGCDRLYQTYSKQTDFGIRFYNSDDTVQLPDGRTPVVRKDASGKNEAVWEYNPADKFRLTVNGQTVAIGDPSGDISTLEYDCGRYEEVDGKYRVETADGDIETYTTKEPFKRDWFQVKKPHIPLEMTYGHFVTIMYYDDDKEELRVYDPQPDWQGKLDQISGKIDQVSLIFKKFAEEFVAEQEGGKLRYEELRTQFRRYYKQWLGGEPPAKNVIGQALTEEMKTAKTDGTDNKYTYFDAYTWCFPQGMRTIDDVRIAKESTDRKEDETNDE